MSEQKTTFGVFVKRTATRWFIDAFSGMAQGLFCTLIAGTILAQIAAISFIKDTYFGFVLANIAKAAQMLMGAGIGVGMAYALKTSKLTTFSAAAAGFLGAQADKFIFGTFAFDFTAKGMIPGNPIGAYIVALLVIEVTSLYAGKTKLDILLIPIGALVISFAGFYLAYPFIWLVLKLGDFIVWATKITPFFMGIIIAVVMGVLLTMPTSSAAIWIAVASTSSDEAMLIAGGAAVVGCACHMVGFAVASFRENGVSGLISQGIGTSMLQIPNIMKKPVVMLPEIIASAILGPIATMISFKCNATGGGMGTSGLVGVFGSLASNAGTHPALLWTEIILLLFVAPAALCLAFSEIFRKVGWIKYGDQKLS